MAASSAAWGWGLAGSSTHDSLGACALQPSSGSAGSAGPGGASIHQLTWAPCSALSAAVRLQALALGVGHLPRSGSQLPALLQPQSAHAGGSGAAHVAGLLLAGRHRALFLLGRLHSLRAGGPLSATAVGPPSRLQPGARLALRLGLLGLLLQLDLVLWQDSGADRLRRAQAV